MASRLGHGLGERLLHHLVHIVEITAHVRAREEGKVVRRGEVVTEEATVMCDREER